MGTVIRRQRVEGDAKASPRLQAVEENAEASPRLLYCERRLENPCGSAYKYPALIEQIVNLECAVTVNPGGVQRECEARKPDLLLVRGDNSKLYAGATVPYLVIEHDIGSLRGNGSENHERSMLSNAAGVLFNSPYLRAYCEERYEMRNIVEVPLEPLARDMMFAPLPKIPRSVVYAGGIRADTSGAYGYRSMHDIARRIIAHGYEFHLYPSMWAGTAETTKQSYKDIGVIVHQSVPNRDLYRELSQYTVGLQAYGTGGTAYPQHCMPNKTYEYRGAGIPTLGYNTGSGYVYDGLWGVWCQDDDLEGALDRAQAMTVTDEYRWSSIEKYAGEVARWIRSALT